MYRLSDKKEKLILSDVKKNIGEFEYEQIGHSHLDKNKTLLLKTKTKKFVLKIKNISESPEEEIVQEVDSRKLFEKILEEAKSKNYFITKVLDHNAKDFWILFEYAEFESLYPIFKVDRERFKQIILKLYKDVIIPLELNIDPETEVSADIGFNDIGYKDGVFYFFDFEPKKKIKQLIVDTYCRLIHIYLLRIKQKNIDDAKYMDDIINCVKEFQKPFIDLENFNQYMQVRLKSPTLQKHLTDEDFDRIYNKFKY